ncbi:MAG: tetratricopeptide repeat protein [Rubrivivax sp.]|nr:tetratricopeptide repeat protein [Rubrivivax sp.]
MQPTLPDSLLSQLSDLLAARIGLHFPAARWNDLERGITAAALAFGMPDAGSCAHRLLSAPLARREIEILASCLTVGETYFFREKRSFEVLEQHILPALLRAREGKERRIRIWSAGCCTGEEPYSMAMLLDRLIPDQAAWSVTVHATDINPVFLRKAAEGEYGEWSFRSAPGWIKDHYFQPQRGGRFKLDERIRKRVAFSYLNLADNSYPSVTNNTNAMDVIFCRNVLMYFSAELARTVIDDFHRALVDGGWLVVSPAETSSVLFSRFTAVEFDGATLYRKDASARGPRFVSHGLTPVPDSRQEPWRLAQGIVPAENMPAVEVFPAVMAATSPPADACSAGTPPLPEQDQPSLVARKCANEGRLGEAAEWCRKAIAADKLDPAHHYLLSAIEQEQGQVNAAVQSLARALYLDPHFVIAHYALGNLYQSLGRLSSARRHFDNALSSLQAYSPGEVLPESDGLTAGRLMEIIESMRSRRAQPAVGL